MVQEKQQDFTTEPGRIVFPNLFEAKPIVVNGREQGDPLFGCEVLFENQEDIKPLIQVAQKLVQERFPNREMKDMQFSFEKGDKKAAKQEEKGRDADFYKGTTVLKATSKYKPGVVDSTLNNIIDPTAIYSGMWGRVHVLLKTYDAAGNIGVKAYLMNVMKTADDEKLVGGMSAKQAFADVATTGQSKDVDPTGGDLPWE